MSLKVLLLGSPTGAPDGVQDYLAHLRAAMQALPDVQVESATMPAFPAPGSMRRLRRAAKACDVVHVQYPMEGWSHSPLPPVLASVLGGRRGPPVLVVTLHEYADLHPLRRLNIAPLLRAADAFVFSSALVADRVPRGLARTPRATIPVGSNIERTAVDWDRAQALRGQWLGGQPGAVVGFFGSLYRAKRPEALLDIAASLQDQGRRAVAVYAGSVNPDQQELPAELAAEAARRGLPAPVFTGYLGGAPDVRATLAAFDAAALMYHDGPSLRRGSMLACLEAGTRVLVPDGPGLAEVRAAPWGSDVLARRQLVVVGSAAEAAAALGESPWARGRFPALQTMAWSEVARRHVELYRSIAGR